MDARDFPTAKIPPAPLLDNAAFSLNPKTEHSSVLSLPNPQFTTSGRAAIALALEHAGITSEHEVMIPAYHCESMVAPAHWRGANVVFYKINRDTSIQIEDILNKITPKTKALIVTHYFGFEQSLKAIRAICDTHQITLIEDCAHALFGLSDDQPIGATGDYAIASCMKFLPIYEGGLIASNRHALNNLKLSAPPFLFQIKSLLNPIEIAINYHRLGLLGQIIKTLLHLKSKLWNYLKSHNTSPQGVIGPSSSEGGFELDEIWIYKSASLFSKLIIKTTPLNQVTQKRREHYTQLNSVFSQLPGCRPLFEKLPSHTVPWVYPLYVDHPDKYFKPLKMAGVPVWRFGEFLDPKVNANLCPVSVEYSQHIFQFPCHQSLSQQEIDWLLNTITKIFNS